MYERPRTRVDAGTSLPSQPPPLRPQQTSLARPKPVEPPEHAAGREAAEDTVLEMEGLYIISVAARILDMHPQTLRKYEKLGLISPGRTLGMLRLYSREDIRKVRLIQHLAGNLGLNLAGVEFALSMVENLLVLRRRLAAAAEGTHSRKVIEQEMADLFHAMDLPLED
jgi:MerR family transcriptional regulator/heat shock protein HspR